MLPLYTVPNLWSRNRLISLCLSMCRLLGPYSEVTFNSCFLLLSRAHKLPNLRWENYTIWDFRALTLSQIPLSSYKVLFLMVSHAKCPLWMWPSGCSVFVICSQSNRSFMKSRLHSHLLMCLLQALSYNISNAHNPLKLWNLLWCALKRGKCIN